jgi:hypothetical protein
MKHFRKGFSRFLWIFAGLTLLSPGRLLAGEERHSAGIIVIAGHRSYSMTDLNRALRDYSRLDPIFTGGGEEIHGGLGAGGGIRAEVTERFSLSVEAVWMDAESRGTTMIDGLEYAVLVDIPALSFSLDAEYSVPLGPHFGMGASAGVGYYMTTGHLQLTRDFLRVWSDLEAEAFGVHGGIFGNVAPGRHTAVTLALGYHRAHAGSLRVDNVEVRSPAGEPIAPDWSGVDVRLGFEVH